MPMATGLPPPSPGELDKYEFNEACKSLGLIACAAQKQGPSAALALALTPEHAQPLQAVADRWQTFGLVNIVSSGHGR